MIFDGRPDSDGVVRKSMKKVSSWRHVPIHSSLVRHGFIEFLHSQQQAGFQRPFQKEWKPREVTSALGQIIKWSHYISGWGGRELKAIAASQRFDANRLAYFHSMHTTVMASYSERSGRKPSFEVSYRFFSEGEGGRATPPHQHTRWDFLYAGDDPVKDGIWMIWPEFISEQNILLPDGPVPMEGKALMFIVNLDNVPYHRKRIRIGTRGYFVEGAKRVAECHVTALHWLQEQ